VAIHSYFRPPRTDVFELARERDYIEPSPLGAYQPLIKNDRGRGGDTVSVTDEGVIVNEVLIRNSKPLDRDLARRVLPRLRITERRLVAGEVFLLSEVGRDSAGCEMRSRAAARWRLPSSTTVRNERICGSMPKTYADCAWPQLVLGITRPRAGVLPWLNYITEKYIMTTALEVTDKDFERMMQMPQRFRRLGQKHLSAKCS
jgi:hypothetical protein